MSPIYTYQTHIPENTWLELEGHGGLLQMFLFFFGFQKCDFQDPRHSYSSKQNPTIPFPRTHRSGPYRCAMNANFIKGCTSLTIWISTVFDSEILPFFVHDVFLRISRALSNYIISSFHPSRKLRNKRNRNCTQTTQCPAFAVWEKILEIMAFRLTGLLCLIMALVHIGKRCCWMQLPALPFQWFASTNMSGTLHCINPNSAASRESNKSAVVLL